MLPQINRMKPHNRPQWQPQKDQNKAHSYHPSQYNLKVVHTGRNPLNTVQKQAAQVAAPLNAVQKQYTQVEALSNSSIHRWWP